MYAQSEQCCEEQMPGERNPMKSTLSFPQDVRSSLIIEKRAGKEENVAERNKKIGQEITTHLFSLLFFFPSRTHGGLGLTHGFFCPYSGVYQKSSFQNSDCKSLGRNRHPAVRAFTTAGSLGTAWTPAQCQHSATSSRAAHDTTLYSAAPCPDNTEPQLSS